MLVLFRFKNFGCFKDETVFDMRAVKSYKEHGYNLIKEENDDALLKVAAVYGANASGKSNFIKAYETFAMLVRTSFEKNNKEESDSTLSYLYRPYFFDETINPTEFEAIYRYNGHEYRYGFIYNHETILYEWLFKTSLKTNRKTTIIDRSYSSISMGSSVRATCEKYIGDIDSDVLALSFFSGLKLRNSVFRDVAYCVSDILPISMSCDGEADFMLNRYFDKNFDESEKVNLLAFLGAIDVGIKDIEVEKSKNNKNHFSVYTYHLGRNNELYRIPFELESDGTKRAIAIYSLVRVAVLGGKGLMIDEFNNQLHPLLQKYLIDLFYEDATEGQLIYTTHDTTLLDKQYMRRDQVWFTNKNDFGESSLYSLAEYKIRNDKSFSKDYLGGVYGGIPILKNFSFKEDV